MSLARTVLAGLCAAGLSVAALSAVAQSEAPKLPPSVKARQANMQLYAYNLGQIGAMAQEKAPYDAEVATAAANNLVALSSIDQTSYWEPGTDNASIEGTHALPAIWDDVGKMSEHREQLHEAAMGLAKTAGDGLDALKAGLGPVGKACGSCHEQYRAKDS